MTLTEKKLAEYKERFNGKELLSPADIAPIIRKSVGVQANMRFFKTFPMPVRKIGSSVYVLIDHLAEFIATGECKDLAQEEEVQGEPLNASSGSLNRVKTPSSNRKGCFDLPLAFMTGWRDSINFQLELIAELEKLELSDSIPDFEEREIKRPFPQA